MGSEGMIQDSADVHVDDNAESKKRKEILINEIKERALKAKKGIQNKVLKVYIPHIQANEMYLNLIEPDFHNIIKDHDSLSEAEGYDATFDEFADWTAEEIYELYYVLYGEEMQRSLN
jgi:hypothetical protein